MGRSWRDPSFPSVFLGADLSCNWSYHIPLWRVSLLFLEWLGQCQAPGERQLNKNIKMLPSLAAHKGLFIVFFDFDSIWTSLLWRSKVGFTGGKHKNNLEVCVSGKSSQQRVWKQKSEQSFTKIFVWGFWLVVLLEFCLVDWFGFFLNHGLADP